MSANPQANVVARRARSEEARQAKLQAILDAALDVFAERGFAARRGLRMSRRGPASPRARSISTSPRSRLCSRRWSAPASAGRSTPSRRRCWPSTRPSSDAAQASSPAAHRDSGHAAQGDHPPRHRRGRALPGASPNSTIARWWPRHGAAPRGSPSARCARRVPPTSSCAFPSSSSRPALVALLWADLFERFEPLDAEAMFDAHMALLMRALQGERHESGAHPPRSSPCSSAGGGGRLLAMRPREDAPGLPGLRRGQPRLHGAGGGRPHRAHEVEAGDRSVRRASSCSRSNRPMQIAQKQRGRGAPAPGRSAARQSQGGACSGRSRSPFCGPRRSGRRRKLDSRRTSSSARRRCSSAASPPRRGSTRPNPPSSATRPPSTRRSGDPGGATRRPLRPRSAPPKRRCAPPRRCCAQAETRLAKRRVSAPASGARAGRFFRAGEVVNAGQPVLSLLPPQPTCACASTSPSPCSRPCRSAQTVAIRCDGCAGGIRAKIASSSREAEYTPPVIFSEQGARQARLPRRGEAASAGSNVADRTAGFGHAARSAPDRQPSAMNEAVRLAHPLPPPSRRRRRRSSSTSRGSRNPSTAARSSGT